MSNDKKKSGDSKQQDAAATKAADQAAGDMEPKERLHNLVDVLQSAPEDLREKGHEEAAIISKQQLERLLGTVEKMASRIAQLEAGSTPAAMSGKVELINKVMKGIRDIPTCGTCGQTKNICLDSHTTVRVLPQAIDDMEGFQGINLNGVTYFGICVVAKAQENEVMGKLRNYEAMRMTQRMDRGKVKTLQARMANAEAAGFAALMATSQAST